MYVDNYPFPVLKWQYYDCVFLCCAVTWPCNSCWKQSFKNNPMAGILFSKEVIFGKNGSTVFKIFHGRPQIFMFQWSKKLLQSNISWWVKRTSVQKSDKNEIFMARVKNSNCLNFCTQVDPGKTRKAVYFFPQMYFSFRVKRTFRFHPLESMNRVITGRKLNTFARFAFQRYYV